MSFKEDYISDETLTSLLIPKGASHYDLNKNKSEIYSRETKTITMINSGQKS